MIPSIHKKTLGFLAGLAKHNDRSWFQENKSAYEAARENILEFTGELIRALNTIDLTIPPTLGSKDCLMRIYRDIRFSKNKTPYKTNFGIAISATGKNFNGPGYYLQLEPGKSFVAGGSWMPETDQLKKIRQEIDYNGEALKDIIENTSFKNMFGDLSEEDMLKTSPKGYDPAHPFIQYLKRKSFTAGAPVSDKVLLSPGSAGKIVEMFETLNPVIEFLRGAIE